MLFRSRTDAAPATWDDSGMTRQREDEDYEPRQLDYGTGLAMTAAVRRKNQPRPGENINPDR